VERRKSETVKKGPFFGAITGWGKEGGEFPRDQKGKGLDPDGFPQPGGSELSEKEGKEELSKLRGKMAFFYTGEKKKKKLCSKYKILGPVSRRGN